MDNTKRNLPPKISPKETKYLLPHKSCFTWLLSIQNIHADQLRLYLIIIFTLTDLHYMFYYWQYTVLEFQATTRAAGQRAAGLTHSLCTPVPDQVFLDFPLYHHNHYLSSSFFCCRLCYVRMPQY